MNRRKELKQVHNKLADILEKEVHKNVPGLTHLTPQSLKLINAECKVATKKLSRLIVKAHVSFRKIKFSYQEY